MSSIDDLFYQSASAEREQQAITAGAFILRGFALTCDDLLLAGVNAVASSAPFRHLITPGGYRMSVGMTNCGPLGWVSDRTGYRYAAQDPVSGKSWPPMPESFLNLAGAAAAAAGYADFRPDACLINCYEPEAKLSLHQDKDELDLDAPIVSVSLGLPAVFLFGGETRRQRPQRYPLYHGDVVVWGGPARLFYHGVAPLTDGSHDITGRQRINLTFRKVN
jgi:alkylated DNA repair protein (DNA oxidative demethylase)